MAATGFTPIQLYRTATAAAVPVNTNLADGELAINTLDEKLYFKNSAGTVKLLADSSAATGTVSTVSVVSANGLAGTVANATTTPAITLSTSITGVLKGNGTAISAAVAGTDYVTPTGVETLTNKTLTTATLGNGYTETVYALSGTEFAATNGSIQTKTLSGNTTFTDSLSSGQSIVLMLGLGSSYTVTFPTTTWVSAEGNVAPTLTAADTLVFWKISSTLYGVRVGSYA